jgi:UDP-glucose 4-epimerase
MTSNSNKRCLVLGGCGFLGSVIVRYLVVQGWHVRVFDKEGVDTARLLSVLPAVEMMYGDFMNIGDLVRALDDMPTVLHFIGTTIPQSSMTDIHFDIETNLLPTIRLLELMRVRPGQRLVYASSGGTVYGIASAQRPLRESDVTEPISSYGISKLSIEKYIRLFGYHYGLPYTILRFANPYGASQYTGRPQGAVGVFLHKVMQAEEIAIWGDGSVIRDYIYEEDVALSTAAVLGTPHTSSGIYNIGTGIGTSLNQLLAIVRRVSGRDGSVSYDASRSFDVPYNVLDVSKIAQETGWLPRYSLEDGIRKMVTGIKNYGNDNQ